jgi:quercetin dioxygenase-like cupin family protein
MTSTTFAFGVRSFGLVLMMCTGAAAVAADSAIVSSSKEVKWGPAPPILPQGAMMAVMAGDPGAAGLVAVRLKMPAGYKIPAHWHPTDEQVTVLSGTLAIGMGDKLDETKV